VQVGVNLPSKTTLMPQNVVVSVIDDTAPTHSSQMPEPRSISFKHRKLLQCTFAAPSLNRTVAAAPKLTSETLFKGTEQTAVDGLNSQCEHTITSTNAGYTGTKQRLLHAATFPSAPRESPSSAANNQISQANKNLTDRIAAGKLKIKHELAFTGSTIGSSSSSSDGSDSGIRRLLASSPASGSSVSKSPLAGGANSRPGTKGAEQMASERLRAEINEALSNTSSMGSQNNGGDRH